MTRNDVERLYVARPFKTLIKQKANENNMSVIEFTGECVKQKNPMENLKQPKRRKINFDFI